MNMNDAELRLNQLLLVAESLEARIRVLESQVKQHGESGDALEGRVYKLETRS